ncbi:peptidoglycan recognition family protein [Oscillatoria sp. CS-180]|uniref:peptidoglycan recognition protein family protein n=1 Tax=Oscillatoria sp. CS-180 TaxID=3021720 RepID=UPI00232E7ADE|nr:peptidoglycan recognition family protein [Oscillatoria sp. CS-180]MDB9524462.1 peptidoglycan recognition family protein [Oscillatoria sp. CS-180]
MLRWRKIWGWSLVSAIAFAVVLLTLWPIQNQLRAIEAVSGLPMLAENAAFAMVPTILSDTESPLDFQPVPVVAQTAYQPRQVIQLADPSNYGDRYSTDAFGQPVSNQFIAVLHETVGSAQSALNLFQTYHANDNDQVSYHTLIGRDGTIYYIVPPEKRAYGAGNSVFNGPSGPETVTTNPAFPSSVNNFAYHISLETPSDGRGNGPTHSGYTQAQYESTAWLLAQSSIPDDRITTHKAVDRSGSRQDPRMFEFSRFFGLLRQYPSRAGLS